MNFALQKEELNKSFISSMKMWCMLFSFFMLVSGNYAKADGLTNLFYTAGFQGNTEVFSHFNWVGQVLSFVISAVCLFGLVFMCLRMIFTVLYKSNENLFDRVHELKTRGKGKSFFGMQEIGRDAWQGNLGVGVDSFIGFLLSMSIDAKELSDYADGPVRYNLQESDTIAQWFMKVSLSYIVTIFFFSAGFSGAIWQAWAVLSDGMMFAAQSFIDTDLTQFVDKALNTGSSFQFAFDDGTELGSLRQSIAKSLYSQVLRKSTNVDTTTKQIVGSDISEWVKSTITYDSLKQLGGKGEKKDSDAKNFTYSVVTNTSSTFSEGNEDRIKRYRAENIFNDEDGGSYYFYVILQRKAAADETNYWEMKDSSGSTGTQFEDSEGDF